MNVEGKNLPPTALGSIEAAALNLLQAVRAGEKPFSTQLHSGPCSIPSLLELANEFLLSKARAKRSDGYLELLVKQLRSFTTGRERRTLASITAPEIEQWLYDQSWSDKTRHGHLLTLRTLFQFAIARCYQVGNPALAVDLPTLTPVEKGVHSPALVKKFLDGCADPDVQRFFAVRSFAELRGSEAKTISESEIRLEHSVIVVNPDICKTHRRRLVTIQPNLKAWLEHTARNGGKLTICSITSGLVFHRNGFSTVNEFGETSPISFPQSSKTFGCVVRVAREPTTCAHTGRKCAGAKFPAFAAGNASSRLWTLFSLGAGRWLTRITRRLSGTASSTAPARESNPPGNITTCPGSPFKAPLLKPSRYDTRLTHRPVFISADWRLGL